MWKDLPELNDFGNRAAPLALGIDLGTLTGALPQSGMRRAFGPRHSATRDGDAKARAQGPNSSLWTEVHGYPHGLVPRGVASQSPDRGRCCLVVQQCFHGVHQSASAHIAVSNHPLGI